MRSATVPFYSACGRERGWRLSEVAGHVSSHRFQFARQFSNPNERNDLKAAALPALLVKQHSIAIDVRRRIRITYQRANLKRENASLKSDPPRKLLRRDLLKLTIVGAGAVGTAVLLPSPASAKPVDLDQKRKARYRPNSQEVRDFYRVNAYPGAR
jgi:hypothetical protein